MRLSPVAQNDHLTDLLLCSCRVSGALQVCRWRNGLLSCMVEPYCVLRACCLAVLLEPAAEVTDWPCNGMPGMVCKAVSNGVDGQHYKDRSYLEKIAIRGAELKALCRYHRRFQCNEAMEASAAMASLLRGAALAVRLGCSPCRRGGWWVYPLSAPG